MKKLVRQGALSLLATGIALALWAAYVPAAAPLLERVGIYRLLGMDPPETVASSGSGRGFGGGALQVVVAPATSLQANARVSAIGDGRALRSVTVRSEAAGMIQTLAVAPGAWVDEGALLLRLNDDAERIALERARLMVLDATRNLERVSQLVGSGTASAVQMREAELALRTAELGVEQAEFDLSQREVTAPIAGWAGLIELAEGDRIGSQDAIVVLTDRSAIQIDFRVPERVIGQLALGMPVAVTALARPDVPMAGEIVAIDNVVDRASRTLRVQAQIDNADDLLRAGQAFEVVLSFPGETLPAVDPLAIQWSGAGAFVWVVREGAAVQVPVAIRQRNSDSVLVEGALEPGEAVVIEGVMTLRPGATVEIVPAAPAAVSEATRAAMEQDS